MSRLAPRLLAIALWLHVSYVVAEATFDDLYENVIPADTSECLDKVRQGIRSRYFDRDFGSDRPYGSLDTGTPSTVLSADSAVRRSTLSYIIAECKLSF